jgi:hypothetical protein
MCPSPDFHWELVLILVYANKRFFLFYFLSLKDDARSSAVIEISSLLEASASEA